MKRRISTLVIAIMWIAVILVPSASLAYESASSRIRIITQHQSRNKKLIMPGHPTLTVYDGGCGLISIAHAMQWLSNVKLSSDGEYQLLQQLVDWKLDTAPNAESAGQGTSRGMSACLSTLSKKDASIVFHKGAMTKSYITEEHMKSLFDDGGVIVCNPSGHYVLAVGYRYYNDKLYIQIVDSSVHSTIKPGWNYNNLHVGYKYDDMTEIKKRVGDVGSQYWIPWNCFAGKCSHQRKFQNWWWISGTSSYLKAVSPTSLSINQNVASLNLSDTLSLTASVYPSNAVKTVNWESSDSSIASVSSSGVVTPHKAGGQVTITATSIADPSVSASCLVTTYYTGVLQFSGIKYPHTYNINKSFTWTGKVESDVELSSVVINLYTSTNKYSQSADIPSGSKSYEMKNFGDTLFKKLPAGDFVFELIATDVMGRKLAFENNGCKATTSGDQVYYNATGTYSRPELKGSAERNGHKYEVYASGARIWEQDRDFAIEKGGHLVTISDADENKFVCDLVVESGGTYAYTGGYYSSGWHWVDGSPFNYTAWRSDVSADSDIVYQAVAGLAPASKYTWGKASNTEMVNFVVEYDPIMVNSIVLEGSYSMTVDETQVITASVLPGNANNTEVRFTSSDTSIASVDPDTGVVTAKAEGFVTVYATAKDGSGVEGVFSFYVMHKPIPVNGLSITANGSLYTGEKKISIIEGERAFLDAIISPYDADNQEVYFISSNNDVALFEETETGMTGNEVTAVGPGTCRLWCYTSDNQFSDYIDLEVLPGNRVAINSSNFPDPSFRAIILGFDTNSDGELSSKEIADVTTISCDCSNIQSLKGIEYFKNLEWLSVRINELKELDISKNTALTFLDCRVNLLTELNLGNNKQLATLYCDNNLIKTLDISQCSGLDNLVKTTQRNVSGLGYDTFDNGTDFFDLDSNVVIYSSNNYVSEGSNNYNEVFILPKNTKTIESQAFAGTDKLLVYIPGSVTFIAADAFESTTTVVCPTDSYAETRCRDIGLTVRVQP